MKNILFYLMILMPSITIFGQTNHVETYQEVMQKFLSNECLSFDMSNIQYADMVGEKVLNQLDFKVVKNGINWYLQTGEYEMIIAKEKLVTIDNASKEILLEKKADLMAEDIFSNLKGFEKIFNYLQLEGEMNVLKNGNTQIDFLTAGDNNTKIELEFNPLNSLVYRSSVVIDMSTYDDLDHQMDGMKIEALYQNIDDKVCAFKPNVQEIINSEFKVLENKDSFNNYMINTAK